MQLLLARLVSTKGETGYRNELIADCAHAITLARWSRQAGWTSTLSFEPEPNSTEWLNRTVLDYLITESAERDDLPTFRLSA